MSTFQNLFNKRVANSFSNKLMHFPIKKLLPMDLNNRKKPKHRITWEIISQPSESLINFKRWNVKTHLSNKNGETYLYECRGRKKFLCNARLRIDRAADSSLSSISFAFNQVSLFFSYKIYSLAPILVF